MRRLHWRGLLFVLLLVPLFVSLGDWQWRKGELKAQTQARRDSRGADPVLAMPAELLAADSARAAGLEFRPLTLRGRFLPERQFLLDNRIHRERAGFHVITPLRLEGSTTVVLVNRGWVPAAARHDELPAIATPDATLTLSGLASRPANRFFSLSADGNTPDWRQAALPVWQHLDQAAFARLSGLPTQGLIVLLDPAAPAGFAREWPRPDERLERHYSYALQWYGFALSTLAIWLYFVGRKAAP